MTVSLALTATRTMAGGDRSYWATLRAADVAHEPSHTILNQRARLEAAGVKQGLLKEVGRNARLSGGRRRTPTA